MSVAQSSSWTSFLKSIALFNGDLLSLTAPPFILSPTSLCEYSQYWAEHPELLVAPASLNVSDEASNSEKSAMAEKRLIAVLKWFISTLRSQYCSRSESMGTEKKPLNPFLGEVFVGKWSGAATGDDSVGETVLVSEQVSHHPPVTAYAILNDKNGVRLQGYNGIKSWISATSINVQQFGHAILEVGPESYLITLPPLHIEGLITASPFVELEGTSYIQSSSGYIAKLDFSGRGYFSGKKNTFKARVFPDLLSSQHKESAICTIAGQWLDKSYITKGGSTPKKTDGLFYDAHSPATHLEVKPIEEQHQLESRKAWAKVADAIAKSDYDLIHKEKSLIENTQRELRKKEEESGIPWNARWFDEVDYEQGPDDDAFLNLCNLALLSIRNAPSGTAKKAKHDTGSAKHWRFNREKWDGESEIRV